MLLKRCGSMKIFVGINLWFLDFMDIDCSMDFIDIRFLKIYNFFL